MVELIVGTYGALCWLVFKKFKLVPVNTYTVATALVIGVMQLAFLALLLVLFHPTANDGRMLALTTPIVPQVRGKVIDVPVEANKPLKKGDVLFVIDPDPFQFEVDRLEALLADAITRASQLEERLKAAQAATAQARADLEASESELDRQAREALEQAIAVVVRTRSELALARKEEARSRKLLESGTITRKRYDQDKQQVEGLSARLREAQAGERKAREKVSAGGDRLLAVRQGLSQAQSQEREARLAFESESGGLNPEVRRITALLDAKRWELAQTKVLAPTDGYVTQLALRPGQMAVPLPLAPVMVFVHDEEPVLIASFPQNVIPAIKAGQEAEIALKSYPGKIFQARVDRILPLISQGQVTATGSIRSLPSAKASGRIPVVLSYGDDVAELKLAAGSQATVAIYTERVQWLAILRRILLRIKSWENYIFIP
jgi:multidrug resistance efflux pump